MAFDLGLAARIREELTGLPGLQEKKMFGGVGFILFGNMACGVLESDLIVRVGSENSAQALQKPFARPFDSYGKPMSGWVLVAPPGYAAVEDLKAWVWQGIDFARTLPPK